jgi:naphthoate synthase
VVSRDARRLAVRTAPAELAHDTNLLFYGSEEAQEGRDAYREKRKPDFSRFPKRA